MGKQPDYIHKKFAPLKDKTLQNALSHRIYKDFPRIGGERIRQLCSKMILEVVHDHLRPADHVTHGQILWMAVSIDDPPSRKRIRDTDLTPVVLDLSTWEDIDLILAKAPAGKRILQKVIRLCKQTYQQGALLSNSDLAELLCFSESRLSRLLVTHERETGQVIPRRATIHDVGTGMTHKRIICVKRYAEGKTSDQIARETYHSIEAVDRYLGQYDRVRHCRLQGLTPTETAIALNCSISLVQEYLKIDQEFEGKSP